MFISPSEAIAPEVKKSKKEGLKSGNFSEKGPEKQQVSLQPFVSDYLPIMVAVTTLF